MASARKKQTTDGRLYYEIRYKESRDKPEHSMRWYVPDGWSDKVVRRELEKVCVKFEDDCRSGLIKTRAETKADEEERDKASKARYTVKRYAEEVFMEENAVTFAKNTMSSFNGILKNKIYPPIGERYIDEVRPIDITNMLLDYQKTAARSSVMKVYTVTSLLFKMAYKNDIIDRNPMDKVDKPKKKKDDEDEEETVEAYDADEIRYIFECLEHEPVKWQIFIRFLYETGVRRGECVGIEWSSVDLYNNIIRIDKTWNYTPAYGSYTAKTKNGRKRVVYISDELSSMMREYKASQKVISKYVFCGKDPTKPMHAQSPTKWAKKFGDKNGIEKFHPHKMRHSFASIAIVNGADISSVSELLGHSDKSVTLRIYAHSDAKAKRDAQRIAMDAIKKEA